MRQRSQIAARAYAALRWHDRMTPRLSISQSVSMTTARTPEYPFASEFARSNIMARVSASASGSPTPTAWERTRFTCSSRICSPAMRTSLSLPTPVVMA